MQNVKKFPLADIWELHFPPQSARFSSFSFCRFSFRSRESGLRVVTRPEWIIFLCILRTKTYPKAPNKKKMDISCPSSWSFAKGFSPIPYVSITYVSISKKPPTETYFLFEHPYTLP
jgi:hypothetical protein